MVCHHILGSHYDTNSNSSGDNDVPYYTDGNYTGFGDEVCNLFPYMGRFIGENVVGNQNFKDNKYSAYYEDGEKEILEAEYIASIFV